MLKKIIVIICLIFVTGCGVKIDDMSYETIINETINKSTNISNVNAIGYKYYLPMNFSVYKDSKFNQVLLSNNKLYYLNVDYVSYNYKSNIAAEHSINDYFYYTFNKNDKDGYLRITKNSDYFFVELCYNYAIIEVEVEEKDLKYAISRSALILNSIKYNDLVIGKYVSDSSIETVENTYKIPEPENKNNDKNVLEYINEND